MKLSMIQLMILGSLLVSCSSKKPTDAKEPVGVDFKNKPTISGTAENPVVRELSTADNTPKTTEDARSYFTSGVTKTATVSTPTVVQKIVPEIPIEKKTVIIGETKPVVVEVTKPVVVEVTKPVVVTSLNEVDASNEISAVSTEDVATTLRGNKTAIQIQKASQNRLKIVDILAREEFQPGYPTWRGINELGLEKKRGQMAGVGWQNAAAMAVVRENGFDDDILLNEHEGVRSVGWTTSTTIRENLLKGSLDKATGIEEVSEEQAQELADRGRIVVVTAIFKKKDGSVNLGFVLPSNGTQSRETKIAAVSVSPQIQTHDEWARLNEEEVQYFAIPQKVEKSLSAKSAQGVALANLLALKIADLGKLKTDKEIATGLKQMIALTKANELVVLADRELSSASILIVESNLESAVLRGDAASIGLEESQIQANLGNVVVAVAKNSKDKNLALVFPSPDKYNVRIGTKLLMIGNSIAGIKTARAVSIDRGASLKFYQIKALKK